MIYLLSVIISFLLIYIVVYLQLRKSGNERSLFSSFSFFFIMYLSVLPFVNLVFAVLFMIVMMTEGKERSK